MSDTPTPEELKAACDFFADQQGNLNYGYKMGGIVCAALGQREAENVDLKARIEAMNRTGIREIPFGDALLARAERAEKQMGVLMATTTRLEYRAEKAEAELNDSRSLLTSELAAKNESIDYYAGVWKNAEKALAAMTKERDEARAAFGEGIPGNWLDGLIAARAALAAMTKDRDEARAALEKYHVPEGWLSQPVSEWNKVLVDRDHAIANLETALAAEKARADTLTIAGNNELELALSERNAERKARDQAAAECGLLRIEIYHKEAALATSEGRVKELEANLAQIESGDAICKKKCECVRHEENGHYESTCPHYKLCACHNVGNCRKCWLGCSACKEIKSGAFPEPLYGLLWRRWRSKGGDFDL